MALLIGVGLSVVLTSGLLVAIIRWVRLRGVVAQLPTHTWEVSCGEDCEPPPAVGLSRAPGAGVPVRVELASGSRTHVASLSLTGNSGSAVEIPCAAVPRGLYRLRRITVTMSDLLSLFAVVLDCPIPDTAAATVPLLRVLPTATHVGHVPVPPGFAAGTPGAGSSWDRSDELIEARPYHPGDDTRRIHWKAYAHSEALFVRIGEEVPPPALSADIVVDTRGLQSSRELDQVVSVALGVAEELERRHYAVTMAVEVDERGPRTLGNLDAGRRGLAAVDPVWGILPDGAPGGAEIPSEVVAHTLIVATGRSPAAPAGSEASAAPAGLGSQSAVLLWDQAQPEGGRHAWTVAFLE